MVDLWYVMNYKLYAGYMPSDLYNLNSSYGSVEELKYCIEEMHSQDLLVCYCYVGN